MFWRTEYWRKLSNSFYKKNWTKVIKHYAKIKKTNNLYHEYRLKTLNQPLQARIEQSNVTDSITQQEYTVSIQENSITQ